MAANIVWLTLESLRFDHTSLSGYKRDTTPFLRSLAAESSAVSFDSCFSHGIWTRPASASILMGTYPSHHQAGMDSDVIPDDLPMIPELLGEQGYDTAGVSTVAYMGLRRGWMKPLTDSTTSSATRFARRSTLRT